MKHLIIITCILLSSIVAFTQNVETDTVSQSKISNLGFMVGQWQGSGWMVSQDRQRHEFKQTEDIQYKLDGTTLLIEGRGTSNGKVIHNALAIVSYNKEEDQYNFQSYLANGRQGTFKAELIDGNFYWYPMENVRYIIEIDPEDQWVEKGEYNNQGNWFQFFEMTLKKL